MDNKTLKKWAIYGGVFISIFGTLSHFMYDFFSHNTFVGLFTPINESVWEHLKMIFWPLIFFSVIQYFFGGSKVKGFFPGIATGVFISELFILAFFYTYNFFLGKEVLVLDIISFYLAVVLCQYINYRLQILKDVSFTLKLISITSIIIMMIVSTVFTFNPPRSKMFYDNNSKSYGIHEYPAN